MLKQRRYPQDARAGDDVDLAVTRARGGFRARGMLTVLMISTLLAIVVLCAVWLLTDRLMPHRSTTAQALAPGAVTGAPSDILPSRTWALARLGPNAVEKCGVFRQVLKQTAQLQVAGGGTIIVSERHRLDAVLSSAKAMAPTSLTPAQCGVPL